MREKKPKDTTVAIIGGGMSGIAAAAHLKRAGFSSFTVYEQSDGPGGTWHDARYPGAAVDTPQPMYAFSFPTNHTFSRRYAKQPELLKYLEETVDDLGLRRHFEFGMRVTEAVWDANKSLYHVKLSDGRVVDYQMVVSAVGFINNPRLPDLPHLDDFAGVSFHSSRWEDVDLANQRVALVGTGSAAAQIAGAIAGEVGSLTVFQRQPGWLLPKPDKVFGEGELLKLKERRTRKSLRARQYIERTYGGIHAQYGPDTATGITAIVDSIRRAWRQRNVNPEQVARDYIAEIFSDRLDLQEAVTPSYRFGGKRVVKDSSFYPALRRENVTLVPREVIDAYCDGLIDADGVKHEFDVVIFATGYHAANFLSTFTVRGRTGKTLSEVWNGEPSAFLGLTVPGFPNFFIMYGPHTNSINLAFMFERQAQFIVRCATELSRGVKSVEVRRGWHDAYNRKIDDLLAKSVITKTISEGVHTYYATSSGRIVGIMPIGNMTYAVLLKLFGPLAMKRRRRR